MLCLLLCKLLLFKMDKTRLYNPIIRLPYSLHTVSLCLSLVIIKITPIVIIMVDIVDVIVQQVQHL